MRRKRIAAWLLCAVLALGLLPATVWAAPPEGRPTEETIEGFEGQDIVKFVCIDDESHDHDRVYGMEAVCVAWQFSNSGDKCTLWINPRQYYKNFYLKDVPDNNHLMKDGTETLLLYLTWSEEKGKWVPDQPVTLPITFYVEEVPDITSDQCISMLDDKPVRFVPAEGSRHDAVYCNRGTTSYWRYGNTYRTVSFEADRYLAQLNAACGGNHTLVDEDKEKGIEVRYDKMDKTWKVNGKNYVEFHFTCDRPTLPVLEELDPLVGNVAVQCAADHDHGSQSFRLQDLGPDSYEVQFSGDNTCQLTVYHAAFVRQFCENSGQQHIFAPGQSDRTQITLVRNEGTGAWAVDGISEEILPLTIRASCDQPAAPTDEEIVMVERAVNFLADELHIRDFYSCKLQPGTFLRKNKDTEGASQAEVTSSDDLTCWEYSIWLDNGAAPLYRNRFLEQTRDVEADRKMVYRPILEVQPHIRLTYVDGEWQVTKGDQATIRVGNASKRFDLNGDGEETVSDLACLYNWLSAKVNDGQLEAATLADKADLNHDGTVDVYDLQLLYEKLSQ